MDKDNIWQYLAEAIQHDRVVPIIGDEFFYAEIDGKRTPYMDFLLQRLMDKFPVPQKLKESVPSLDIKADFNLVVSNIRISNNIANLMSQMYGSMQNPANIYCEIDEIVQQNPVICDTELIRFIQRTNFNLILTTSFLPGVENILRQINPKTIVKSYDRSPRIDYNPSYGQTLYHLFGKSIKINKGFMVTEDDLLDYMHYWHNVETRPKQLCNYLSDKFLLILGCDYPNWLFRFFWHSVKNFKLQSDRDSVSGIVAGNLMGKEAELIRFLSRIQAHAYGDCSEVIKNILEVLPETNISDSEAQPETETGIEAALFEDCDIFVSYAHEDSKQAKEVAEILKRYGAKVWIDNADLVISDKYDDIIRHKIETCKRFVPLLSTYTQNTARGYFRKEWSLAIKESDYRLGSPYISPIIIDDSDIQDIRFPKEFQDAHTMSYNDDNFEGEVKKFIRSFRK